MSQVFQEPIPADLTEKIMRASIWMAGLAAVSLMGSGPLRAEQPGRLVVVELFTSQGCSSCPPADELLTELARDRRDVLPLAFHVTYWNSLGWKDPFSLEAATSRQRGYASLSGIGGIYTPQAVVNGSEDVIGSDRPALLRALRSAAGSAAVPVQATRDAAGISIAVGAGSGGGKVLLVGYDAQHRTKVARGENAGATLVESNIVRALEPIGDWRGAKLDITHAAIAGERMAVILQGADGRIIGAALVPDPA